MKKSILIIVCILLLFTVSLQAQESVNATGGNASSNAGTVCYSVGQVVYATNTGSTGSVAHGVQQPFEISVITGINETTINLTISAYPNPTTNFLQLKVESEKLKDLSFQLYGMSGELLQSDKIISKQTNINMSNLAPGTYFVKVARKQGIGNQQEIKTFKVIKL